MSVEPDCPSDTTGLIGASLALSLSEIPFAGPVAAVHVGRVDGKFLINPTSEQNNKSDLDLIVAGTKDAIIMVEAGAQEVPEEVILDAIFFGHEEIKKIVAFQEEIVAKHGRSKIEVEPDEPDPEIAAAVQEYATPKLLAALKTPEKLEREAKLDEVKDETHEYFQEKLGEEEYALKAKDISGVLDTIIKEEVRKMISWKGSAWTGGNRRRSGRSPAKWGYSPHPRFGTVHPWPDPGPFHCHPGPD